MSLLALIVTIYIVSITVSIIACVFFNWHEGDDLTLKELGSIMVASIIPIVNMMLVVILLFNASNVANKVLIKGKNKNEQC